MKFFDMLEARIKKSYSLLCVGLDPHGVELTEHTPEGLKVFCSRLIEATKDVACCYKPNSAFFEAIPGGVEALAEVARLFMYVSYRLLRPFPRTFLYFLM